jgi:hypothetical protein
VTESAEVMATEGSDGEIAMPCGPEMLPEGGLVPDSDPFADVPALLSPPALAEFNEYMEEEDMRLPSLSFVFPCGLNALSGNFAYFFESAMIPGASLGVSESSIAPSDRGRLEVLSVQASEVSDCRRLPLRREEGLDIGTGLEGGGMDMLAGRAFMSVVPGSACLPFRVEPDESPAAKERR